MDIQGRPSGAPVNVSQVLPQAGPQRIFRLAHVKEAAVAARDGIDQVGSTEVTRVRQWEPHGGEAVGDHTLWGEKGAKRVRQAGK